MGSGLPYQKNTSLGESFNHRYKSILHCKIAYTRRHGHRRPMTVISIFNFAQWRWETVAGRVTNYAKPTYTLLAASATILPNPNDSMCVCVREMLAWVGKLVEKSVVASPKRILCCCILLRKRAHSFHFEFGSIGP